MKLLGALKFNVTLVQNETKPAEHFHKVELRQNARFQWSSISTGAGVLGLQSKRLSVHLLDVIETPKAPEPSLSGNVNKINPYPKQNTFWGQQPHHPFMDIIKITNLVKKMQINPNKLFINACEWLLVNDLNSFEKTEPPGCHAMENPHLPS